MPDPAINQPLGLVELLECDSGSAHRRSANVRRFVERWGVESSLSLALQALSESTLRAYDRAASEVVSQWVVASIEVGSDADRRLDWMTSLARHLSTSTIPWRARMLVSADVAWAVRSHGLSPLDALLDGELDQLLKHAPFDGDRQILSLLAAQFARYDYRFDAVYDVASRMRLQQSGGSDGFSDIASGFEFFARSGNVRDAEQEEDSPVPVLIAKMRDPSEQDNIDPKLASLTLHALWFRNTDRASEEMLPLADWLITLNPFDWVSHYRRAAALRRLGRFDEAIVSISRAGEFCGSADIEMTAMIHRERSDIFRQRETLSRTETSVMQSKAALEQAMAAFESEVDSRLEEFQKVTDERLSEVSSRVAGLTFSVLEVLALFTALIGLLGTVLLGAFTGDLLWWHRVFVILAGTAGMVVFLVAVHVVARSAANGD